MEMKEEIFPEYNNNRFFFGQMAYVLNENLKCNII